VTCGAQAGAVAALGADVPVTPSVEQARAWAVEELAKREYAAARPSLLARALSWLYERLSAMSSPSGTGSAIVVGLVLLALAVVVVIVARRTGVLHRTSRGTESGGLFGHRVLTAAEHRAAADRHGSEGDLTRAVLERFRAVVRELDERAVLVPQPGRTADEAARDAGLWLPELAADLGAAARLFDDVRYGGRPGTAEGDRDLRRLDTAVRAARPAALSGRTPAGSGSARAPS
jgi:hypothetical protein